MTNDFRICRPYGASDSLTAVSTKMSLLTELRMAAELGVKAGVLIHPARLAVTGNPHGPSSYHLLEVLGKEKVMGRIERALAAMN